MVDSPRGMVYVPLVNADEAWAKLVVELAALRERAGGPSLRTVAAAAGCSHTTVSKCFAQERKPVSVHTLHGICGALGADEAETARCRALWKIAKGAGETPSVEPPQALKRLSAANVPLMVGVFCFGLLLVLVVVVVVSARPGEIGRNQLIVDIAQLAFISPAPILFGVSAWRNRRQALFKSFLLISVGTFGWTIGQLMWTIKHNVYAETVPALNFANVAYYLLPLFGIPALWLRARHYGTVGENIVSLASGLAILSFAALTATLSLVYTPALLSDLNLAIALFYPATGLMLTVLSALQAVKLRIDMKAIILAVGFGALTLSDTAYVIITSDPRSPGLPVGTTVGYMVFGVAMTVSALFPTRTAPVASASSSGADLPPFRLALQGVAMIAALAVVGLLLWHRGLGLGVYCAVVLLALLCAMVGLRWPLSGSSKAPSR